MNRRVLGLLLSAFAPIALYAYQKLRPASEEPAPAGSQTPPPQPAPAAARGLKGADARIDQLYAEAAKRYAAEDYAGAAALLSRILKIDPGYRDADRYLRKARFMAETRGSREERP